MTRSIVERLVRVKEPEALSLTGRMETAAARARAFIEGDC